MRVMYRRGLLTAAGTLAAATLARKPRAEDLADPSALVPTLPRRAPPAFVFTSADGTEHRLDEFAGHGMVINMWATWCVPCVAELPALDALSAELARDDIAVLPLSSDRGGAGVVQKFYAAHGLTHLPVLLDPKGAAARAWGLQGIPTTFVIDRHGLECARLEGAADWSKAAGRIRHLVGGKV